MATNTKRKWSILLFSICIAIILGLVATVIILAASIQSINTSINISYIADGIFGTVSASYKIGSQPQVDMLNSSGDTIIDFSNPDDQFNLSPAGDIILTPSESFVVFKYNFTNTHTSKIYLATLTYTDDTSDDSNITFEYSSTGTNYTTENNYFRVNPNSNATYYVKVSVANTSQNATCTGNFSWQLSFDENLIVETSAYENAAQVTGLKNKSITELHIPDSVIIDGIERNIVSIAASAFQNCTSLRKVTMTNNITEILTTAFRACYNLSDITFSNNLIEIGNGVFDRCGNLYYISIPESVQKIGMSVFVRCPKIAQIEMLGSEPPLIAGNILPNESILIIGINNLQIKIPTGSEETYTSTSGWSNYATLFTNTFNLMNFIKIDGILYAQVPSGNLGVYTSYKKITNITIPNNINIGASTNKSVNFICFGAFAENTDIESIVLPSTILQIDNYAFQNCKKLTRLEILATSVPKLNGSGVFIGTNTNLQIKVPASSLSTYQSASNWSTYSTKIVSSFTN